MINYLLLNWIMTGMIGVIIIKMVISKYQKGILNPYLSLSALFLFVSIMFENLSLKNIAESNQLDANLFYTLHIFFMGIHLTFLFDFLNSIVYNRPPMILSIINMAFLTNKIGSLLLFLYLTPNRSIYNGSIYITLARILCSLYMIYIDGILACSIYIRQFLKKKDLPSFLVLGGFFLMAISYIPRFLRDISALLIMPYEYTLLAEIADFINLIAIVIFLAVYFIHDTYFFRLPYDVYFLGIYTTKGMEILRYEIKTEKPKQIDTKILSGLLKAFNIAYRTTFKAKMPIQTVRSKDFTLIFENQAKIMVVLGADRTSFVLFQSLKHFTKDIAAYIEANNSGLERMTNDNTDFSQFLQRSFPYLEFPKNEESRSIIILNP